MSRRRATAESERYRSDMRRLLAAIGVTVAVLVPAQAGFAGPTELRISLWPQGKAEGVVESWTLRCTPAGGSLPNAARACRHLGAIAQPFAPAPRDTACTQIYGGPQVALVSGSFRGRRVWTYFKRTDGCQADRWNRVAFLFPA